MRLVIRVCVYEIYQRPLLDLDNITNVSSYLPRVIIMLPSDGPVPTHLTLLSDLSSFSARDKVRFLGWLVMAHDFLSFVRTYISQCKLDWITPPCCSVVVLAFARYPNSAALSDSP